MFGQTLFARLATERFVCQTPYWTKMFDHLARPSELQEEDMNWIFERRTKYNQWFC